MPLCSSCKSEAEYVNRNGNQVGGERKPSNPPHGMEWGESCDRCDNAAEVTINA